MNHRKTRSVVTAIGAMATAALLTLGGVTTAQAVDNIVDQMPEASAVVITKLEQPAVQGVAANGLPQTIADAKPIAGVKFEAYAVPGLPVPAGSQEWQAAVSNLNVAAATAAVGANPAAVREGTTNTDGIIKWDATLPAPGATAAMNAVLPRGVYLIRETSTPAGVIPSNDFLLTAPLTDPSKLDSWLNTIYVYPKNTVVGGTKTVVNETVYTVGSVVPWTISIDNPSVRDQNSKSDGWFPTDLFTITDVLNENELEFVDISSIVAGGTSLVKDTDWTVSESFVEATKINTVTVSFTEAGLAKIAAAKQVHGDKVVMTLNTKVMTTGALVNSARTQTSSAQVNPTEIPPSEVRYGVMNLVKKSSDDSETVNLKGAEFRVYLSKDAALAAKNSTDNAWGGTYSATNTNGYVVPAGTTGVFTTDEAGKAVIGGLRASDFADGAAIENEADYLTYWLVETKGLNNHQLLSEPVSFVVKMKEPTTVNTLDVTNYEGGGFDLPLTGGMGTALLTAGGIALLAVVLVVARRRRNESVIAE